MSQDRDWNSARAETFGAGLDWSGDASKGETKNRGPKTTVFILNTSNLTRSAIKD